MFYIQDTTNGVQNWDYIIHLDYKNNKEIYKPKYGRTND